MTSQQWDRLYERTLRASASVNWEFVGGVVLLGSLWAVIVIGFAVIG
jgi:hypothetical protein